MNSSEKTELARAWISLQETFGSNPTDNPNFWAYAKLDDICDDDPILALELILLILELDKTDRIIENLSAGPLEDLLVRHGESVIDKVIECAEKSPEFSNLLGGVWQNSMSDEVWQKIKLVSGKSW